MERAEQPVDPRKMHGEVPVDRGDRVVPVVEARGDQQLLDPAEREAQVDVDEGGLRGDDDHPDVECAFGEAEHEQRHEDQAARDDDVDDVKA